jgi:hypothetical protein
VTSATLRLTLIAPASADPRKDLDMFITMVGRRVPLRLGNRDHAVVVTDLAYEGIAETPPRLALTAASDEPVSDLSPETLEGSLFHGWRIDSAMLDITS